MKILKHAIISGSLFGLVFGLIMFLFTVPAIIYEGVGAVPGAILSAIVIFVLSGTLFGLIMGLFAKMQAKKFASFKNEFAKEYDIIYDDGANHVITKEAVGGWLFLTPEGLFFISHKLNIQQHKIWIPIGKIRALSTYKNLGIIKNGLRIEKRDGSVNKFVVFDTNEWISKIEPLVLP